MNIIAHSPYLSRTLLLLATLATTACLPPTSDPAADGGTDDAGGQDADGGGTDSADGESGASGDCTVVAQADLAADLTLPEGCYLVEELLTVDGVTLSIEPGAELNFAPMTGVVVGSTGVLSAIGAHENPVVFQGTEDAPGSWRGVGFTASASSSNRLESVEILDAGLADFGLLGETAAVELTAGSRLAVVDASIHGSAGFGVAAAEGAELTMQGTTVSDNARAMSLGIATVGGVSADNALVGNDEDIAILAGTTLTEAATWAAFGLPLHPQAHLYVNAALTLEPGVTIAMPQDRPIEVFVDGSMSAVGTAEAPVVFTGQLPEVGYWQGIAYQSKSSSNVLDGAVVEYAGGEHWNGGQDSRTAIYAEENSKVLIQNSTVRHSAWYALTAIYEASIEGFAGNRIEGNVRALNLHPDLVGSVEADNAFVDNDDNVVRMTLSNTDRVITAQTWKNVGVPLHVSLRTFIEAPVTVEAGVTVQFEQEAALFVTAEGALNFEGTADAPILVTGVEKVPGYWRGIEYGTLTTGNAATHTRFEYAGASGWHGGSDASSTLYVTNEGRLALSDVTIADGAGHGVKVANDGSTLECAGVTFENLEGDATYGPIPNGCQ